MLARLSGDRCDRSRASDEDLGAGFRAQHRALDRRAVAAERIGFDEGRRFVGIVRVALAEDTKIASDEEGLFVAERPRTGMADKDRGIADDAVARRPRAEAKVDIFEIAAMKALGERADCVETGALDVEAEAGRARDLDDGAGVDLGGDRVELGECFARGERIGSAGDGEARQFPIVGEGHHDSDVRSAVGGGSEAVDETRRRHGVGVEEDDIAPLDGGERPVDGADEAEVVRVFDQSDPRIGCEATEIGRHPPIGCRIVDDRRGMVRVSHEFGDERLEACPRCRVVRVDRDDDGDPLAGGGRDAGRPSSG